MGYRLICTDIDGTLLNKDRELSTLTIQEVKRIKHIPFVLISSRMPEAMLHLQHEFDIVSTPIIAYNGGLVINNGRVLHSTFIENVILEHIINQCVNTSIHLSLYHADEWYVPAMDYWANRESNNTKVIPSVKSNLEVLEQWIVEDKGAHKIMCMGEEAEIDVLYNALEASHAGEIILYRSKPTYIEIAHRSISKKTAIDVLLAHCYPEVSMEHIVAFGDNYNDMEMLKAVGLGVAVGNAKEAVLEIANMVVDTNKNDGVAKCIQEIF